MQVSCAMEFGAFATQLGTVTMKLITHLAAGSLLFSSMANAGLLSRATQPEMYIVQLDAATVATQGISQITGALLGLVGAESAVFEYDTVLKGFAAPLTELQAELLANNPLVTAIEKDRVISLDGVQTSPTWGLDRSDETDIPVDGEYAYPAQAGAGVHVYVIDTGINPDHSEFTGRVGNGQNFVSDGPLGLGGLLPIDVLGLLGFGEVDPDAWQDCNGHGTHVSGTTSGTTYGVAKQSTIHAVRVLNCGGSGSGSGVIAGMEWVAENAQYPAVVNMSLGGGASDAEDAAIQALFDANILPVVAAGNDDTDACTQSPARAPAAVTVASSDSADNESSFSNHGTCVDIIAPGSDITSADYSNNTGSTTMSGTSMASPHVAGAAALILGQTPSLSAGAVANALISNATVGKIALSPANAGTPNLLLNVLPEAVKK